SLLDGSRLCRLQGAHANLLGDVAAVDVVEVAVPGLTRDRQQPRLGYGGMVEGGPAHDRTVSHAHGVGIRDTHRPAHGSRLVNPRHPSHLAVAVLGVVPRGARVAGVVTATGMDGGHSGAD